MTRYHLLPLTLILALLYFVLISAAHAQELRLGTWKAITAPALYVGKAKGYFDQEGVKVREIDLGRPASVLEGMAAGKLDAGSLTSPPYIRAKEKGVNIMAVALIAGRFKPGSSYLVRRDSGINTVEDLKGKSIGVHEYGGVFDIYLRSHLERYGLDPKRDVKIVEVPFFTVIQGLLAKTIDAGAVDSLFAKVAEAQFADKLKILFSYYDVEPVKGRDNTLILSMTKDLVTKKRDIAKRFLSGYLKAIKFTHDQPQETLKIWAEAAGTPIVAKLEEFRLPLDGKIDLPMMKIDIELSRRYGYLKADLKAEELIDYSLLDEIIKGR